MTKVSNSIQHYFSFLAEYNQLMNSAFNACEKLKTQHGDNWEITHKSKFFNIPNFRIRTLKKTRLFWRKSLYPEMNTLREDCMIILDQIFTLQEQLKDRKTSIQALRGSILLNRSLRTMEHNLSVLNKRIKDLDKELYDRYESLLTRIDESFQKTQTSTEYIDLHNEVAEKYSAIRPLLIRIVGPATKFLQNNDTISLMLNQTRGSPHEQFIQEVYQEESALRKSLYIWLNVDLL